MKKNKNYSKEYKFKVIMEMIRGDLTTAEIISKYQVPSSVLHRWKKQLLENGPNIFESGAFRNVKNTSSDGEIDKLHATIGRLKVENDFLHQVSAKLKL
jgi:transposase